MTRNDKNVVDLVRAALPKGAVVLDKCCENGCCGKVAHKIKLIVKGESLASPSQKAVDCIFFVDRSSRVDVITAELKNRNYHVSEVIKKHEDSESAAIKIVANTSVTIGTMSRVVFCQGGTPRVGTPEHVLLVKRGRVRVKRCGDTV